MEENGPPARHAREGAVDIQNYGPPARQAREGADKENFGKVRKPGLKHKAEEPGD
ncbi:Hypothetical predicted protein [Mytilus galloprovincialis]|uniref:Uncharacterized protein n=1 Tax=Mytilus galloprovincialis TaxID=29158 RepID=A0A8B6ETB2_MYTGA|nr:Hypothetical predicted protein [Mytilus galloprovincialis]